MKEDHRQSARMKSMDKEHGRRWKKCTDEDIILARTKTSLQIARTKSMDKEHGRRLTKCTDEDITVECMDKDIILAQRWEIITGGGGWWRVSLTVDRRCHCRKHLLGWTMSLVLVAGAGEHTSKYGVQYWLNRHPTAHNNVLTRKWSPWNKFQRMLT